MYKDWMTNRDKKLEPKHSKFWCYKCDACLVNRYKKCTNCGHRNGKRINKK